MSLYPVVSNLATVTGFYVQCMTVFAATDCAMKGGTACLVCMHV